MSAAEQEPLHLRRFDAACNMRRFYTLAVQRTLFGEVSLIRRWGRIGTNGQVKLETFDHSSEAEKALERLARSKRRRGYADVG